MTTRPVDNVRDHRVKPYGRPAGWGIAGEYPAVI